MTRPNFVFGFWTKGVGPHGDAFPAESKAAWLAFDSRFVIFDDEAVLKALSSWSKEMSELYLDIRIPACRSDIARLILLSEFGGTYVDAHTGPGNVSDLRDYLDRCESYELVVPQFDAQESPIAYNRLFSSPLSARAGSPVLMDLLRRALGNLLHQRDSERRARAVDLHYSIFDLTGPNMLRDRMVDFSCWPPELRAPYQGSVLVADLEKKAEGPFQLYRYCAYRKRDNHWAMREKSEPLFHSSGAWGD